MATITKFPLRRHLRADPNQWILHFQGGKLRRSGAGIACWFSPLSAAVAQVPVEDCETTFLLHERSKDLQEVAVQCTLVYRVKEPEKAARRFNFSISLVTGAWIETPLERIASLFVLRAQHPARAYLSRTPVVEAVRAGADVIREAIVEALTKDAELGDLGLAVVNFQVVQIAPSADLEKALQTPTREEIQQRADEAGFARRANAVEKERAIKQNELATEIDLAHRQAELIGEQGKNRMATIAAETEAERARMLAQIERDDLAAKAYAEQVLVRAKGDADTIRALSAARGESEAGRVALWRDVPSRVALGLAAQELAAKLQTIQHLNITPDMLGDTFRQMLRDQPPGAAPAPPPASPPAQAAKGR